MLTSSFRVFASCVESVTNSKLRISTFSNRDLSGNYEQTHASQVTGHLGSCQGFDRYSCLQVSGWSSRLDAESTR